VQSFWQPQHTPSSDLHASKPSMDVLCPVTSKKLKMKDLTPIKFTPASDGIPNSFVDPVSNDSLNNSSKLVAIKATGDVMLEKTYKTCIKPDGIYKGMLLMAHRVRASRCRCFLCLDAESPDFVT
jgi:nitric oxide synthase-interacting protein